MHASRFGILVFATLIVSGCATPSRAQQSPPAQQVDRPCPAANVRNTSRAILCARVIDRRTGVGVPGGQVQFVRDDGASMAGTIQRDGTFSLNVPGGRGRLTIAWSCRASTRMVETLTIPAGQGTARTFTVSVVPSDTLCRRELQDRTDTTRAAITRWINRGPCLAISLGPWGRALGSNDAPPQQVRLDSLAQSRSRAGSSQPLHYDPPSGTRWHFAGWRPMVGDSLNLYWSTGFTGVSLTLGVAADSLAGRGIWTHDVVITDSLGFRDTSGLPKGAASARRVQCE
jgi:hypothetical protein